MHYSREVFCDVSLLWYLWPSATESALCKTFLGSEVAMGAVQCTMGVRSDFTQSIDSISCNLFVLSVPLLGVYFSSDEQTIKISKFASGKLQVVSRDEKKQACKQCLCNLFSSSGKICAKFYGFLSQKWEMLQVCAFIVICLAFCNYDGILWYLLELLWDFMALFGTFGLLHCFVES